MPVARKRKALRSAKKTWRFIQRQRRRRKKMDPTRRKQENASLFILFAGLPLAIFLLPSALVFVGTASGALWVASKASPPKKTYRPRRVKEDDEKFSGWFTHKQALTLKKGHPCNDTCKYSTHDKSTCVCSCGTKNHGIWAWGPSGTTTPNQRKTRRTTTRRRSTTTRKRRG